MPDSRNDTKNSAKQDKPGNIVSRFISTVNAFQQRHKVPAFAYAVIKKYGDDEASLQGALITYYAFLSIFPLLIVATSVIELIGSHNDALRMRFVTSFNDYFPVIGQQLQSSVHGTPKSGLALVIGIIIALLGARGGAAALQHALNHIWQVPRPHRAGFPKSVLKNLNLIVVGGVGTLGAATLSSVATSLGHGASFKIFSSLISIIILFGTFLYVFRNGTDGKDIGYKDFLYAAGLSAIGFQVLQLVGGYYITHEMGNLKTLYSTFAIVLGLLAWIYLQAQIMLYALEAATVRSLQLWPRSMEGDKLTAQDKRAYVLYAQKEKFTKPENIEVDIP
jgi:membrane protein